MSVKRFTPEKIENLKRNEVFVFGSNVQGEHVGGAAFYAATNFGANYGLGIGLQGSSYAIPTCIRLTRVQKGGVFGERYTKPFESVEQIKPYVEVFINDAMRCQHLTFYVTKIGCGIAGFKISEIAELFRPCLEMDNVILPKEFVEHLLYTEIVYSLNERGLQGGKDYDDDLVVKYVIERIHAKGLDDILDEFQEMITL